MGEGKEKGGRNHHHKTTHVPMEDKEKVVALPFPSLSVCSLISLSSSFHLTYEVFFFLFGGFFLFLPASSLGGPLRYGASARWEQGHKYPRGGYPPPLFLGARPAAAALARNAISAQEGPSSLFSLSSSLVQKKERRKREKGRKGFRVASALVAQSICKNPFTCPYTVQKRTRNNDCCLKLRKNNTCLYFSDPILRIMRFCIHNACGCFFPVSCAREAREGWRKEGRKLRRRRLFPCFSRASGTRAQDEIQLTFRLISQFSVEKVSRTTSFVSFSSAFT